jgi:IS30 family transposase
MPKGDNAGRPTKTLTDDQRTQVEALAAYLSQEQIADYFGIGKTTWFAMMQRDPDISERYKRGKAKAIGAVAQGLLQKARNGDNAASMFYLKTQAGWRETQQVDHTSSDGSMTPKGVPDDLISALDAIAGKIAGGDSAS